jgi:hypothetical protein
MLISGFSIEGRALGGLLHLVDNRSVNPTFQAILCSHLISVASISGGIRVHRLVRLMRGAICCKER